ncbi:flavodoxin domain-containing protein [Klebsiella pneumoniae subsp. pneumoniae]|nr:flavodoxin domain-containing protein [Klebsiella pneumoniae subsp. pneumoniae]
MKLVNAGDYKFKQIAAEKLLVVVTSTQGKESRRKKRSHCISSLFSKKAPKLDGTAFAVFGLGDTSLMNFSASPAKISTTSWPRARRGTSARSRRRRR